VFARADLDVLIMSEVYNAQPRATSGNSFSSAVPARHPETRPHVKEQSQWDCDL